jgi:diguanylate cyclase (GGDEF)-like protein
MPSETGTSPTAHEQKQLMGRTAAAIWASIGAFGLLVTFEPLRATVEHIAEIRAMAAATAVIAALLVAVPARYLPEKLFPLLPVPMVACIGALAFAGGPERGDLTILFTFVAVFSAYFFSWRVSFVHIGLMALLLTSRMFLSDPDQATGVETIRFSILLPALFSVWALVSLLSKGLVDREARLKAHEIYDLDTGLLGVNGLDQMLDAETARATRHARPLSLIRLEVFGPAFTQADDETIRRTATVIARSIIGRVRAEDRAARLGGLKFAVLAIECGESGAIALSKSLAEQVRKRLLSVGYDAQSFTVAIGWADYHQAGASKPALVREAEETLSGAASIGDGIALPARTKSMPPPAALSDLQAAR